MLPQRRGIFCIAPNYMGSQELRLYDELDKGHAAFQELIMSVNAERGVERDEVGLTAKVRIKAIQAFSHDLSSIRQEM